MFLERVHVYSGIDTAQHFQPVSVLVIKSSIYQKFLFGNTLGFVKIVLNTAAPKKNHKLAKAIKNNKEKKTFSTCIVCYFDLKNRRRPIFPAMKLQVGFFLLVFVFIWDCYIVKMCTFRQIYRVERCMYIAPSTIPTLTLHSMMID